MRARQDQRTGLIYCLTAKKYQTLGCVKQHFKAKTISSVDTGIQFGKKSRPSIVHIKLEPHTYTHAYTNTHTLLDIEKNTCASAILEQDINLSKESITVFCVVFQLPRAKSKSKIFSIAFYKGSNGIIDKMSGTKVLRMFYMFCKQY